MICGVPDASGKMEGRSEDDGDSFSCSVKGNMKRTWETSCTSLMSKKVKGTHSEDHSPSWTRYGGVANSLDRNCSSTIGSKFLPDTAPANDSISMHEKVKLGVSDITRKDFGTPENPSTTKCHRIMLMNIADADKKSCLTKV